MQTTQTVKPASLPLAPASGSESTTVGTYFVSNYPPFSTWDRASLDAVRARLDAPPAPGTPLGLYVHVPFCRKRCHFCYFKVYTERNASEVAAYVERVVDEARLHARRALIAGRSPSFVYIGGGTPSYLSTNELLRLFSGLRSALPWDAAEEIAFECEPGTISEAKLAVLKDAGVTRLSLGVESFDDAVLAENGRAHQSRQIFAAYEAARRVGLPQINLDLITGMLGETDAIWDAAIERTVELAPDSVTIYQMELPPNTTIARDLRARAGDEPRTGDVVAREVATWPEKRARLERAFERLEASGYRVSSAYTLVRKAQRPGERDLRFRYRDCLWTGADLLPLGVSSFGHLGGAHLQNEKEIEVYMARVAAGEIPLARGHLLTPDERLTRELILQLKLGAIRPSYFVDKFGVDPRARFADAFAALVDGGYVEPSAPGETPADRVALTRKGLLCVDSLLPAFYLPAHREPHEAAPAATTSARRSP